MVIPVWALSIVAMVVFSASSLETLYPTQADRNAFAASVDDSAALVAIRGIPHGLDTLGGQLAWQVGWFAMLATGLMSLLLVVRHTRADEETGRTELLLATPVGRHAPLVSSLGLVAATNLLVAGLIALGIGLLGASWAGTIALSASVGAVGLVFAGVAAVAAQLAPTARGATGMASGVLGAAYLIRALADVQHSGLARLSPLGLAQAIRPYDGDHWWPLAGLVVVAVALGLAAVWLLDQRDLGGGIVASRPGPSHASSLLATPLGLAVRLHRAALGWWAVALFLLGAAYGSIASDVGDLLSTSAQVEDMFIRDQQADQVDAFFATTALVMALMATGFMIGAVLRLRTEENAGRAEPVLSTAVSRFRWASSHVLVGALGSAVLLLVAGAGAGLVYGLQGAGLAQVPRLAGAMMAQAPAVWVMGGLTLLAYGVAPRLASLAWVVLGWCLVAGLMAPLLGLPDWAEDASPYAHIPQLPAQSLTAGSLGAVAVVASLAASLGAVGFLRMRRRDLV